MKIITVEKLYLFVLILVFNVSIFLPLIVGIFEEDQGKSIFEKRMLNKLPALPKTIDDIKNFPQSFDNYYSDHFGLRNWFVRFYKVTKYIIGDSPSDEAIVGKNGWLFLGSIKKSHSAMRGDPIGDARNVHLFSEDELGRFARYASVLNGWLKEKGIEYIFVIAPIKHTIYFEQLPNYISKENDRSATDQIVDYLQENTDVRVIDLKHSLLDKKQEHQLYFKKDTHWNHYGANIAQYEIMSELEKFFPGKIHPEMTELENATRKGGDLATFTGLHNVIESDPQPKFEKTCMPVREPSVTKTGYSFICNGQELNALIFRDSFFEALRPYFYRKFHKSTFVWERMQFESLVKYIEAEHPDVIIEEIAERFLPYVPDDEKLIRDICKHDAAGKNKNFLKDCLENKFASYQQ